MRSLVIPKQDATPYIEFDVENKSLEIRGNSYDDDAYLVYNQLQERLNEYVNSEEIELTVKIFLEYYNTSSSKCLYNIFDAIKVLEEKSDSQVKVLWAYPEGDENMKLELEDFMDFVGVNFDIAEAEDDDF